MKSLGSAGICGDFGGDFGAGKLSPDDWDFRGRPERVSDGADSAETADSAKIADGADTDAICATAGVPPSGALATAAETAAKPLLLAVCGSISFYKAFDILSAWRRRGVRARVLLSPGALRFASRAAFSPFAEVLLAEDACWAPGSARNHIAISRGCSAVVMAPASANSINSLAAGLAASEFGAALLAASDLPLLIAPAANPRMLAGPTAESLGRLAARGAVVMKSARKRLACGEFSEGGCAPAEAIALAALHVSAAADSAAGGAAADLTAKTRAKPRVIVTSGGTREAIDDARCLANFSTGAFGAAIAAEAYAAGFSVLHIRAAGSARACEGAEFLPDFKECEFASTAELAAALKAAGAMAADADGIEVCGATDSAADSATDSTADDDGAPDVLIMAAAVADFLPQRAPGKLSRADFGAELRIAGCAAPDVLASSRAGLKVAFKLEPAASSAALAKAAAAASAKGARLCVFNAAEHAPFGAGSTRIWLLDGHLREISAMSGEKPQLAREIVKKVREILAAKADAVGKKLSPDASENRGRPERVSEGADGAKTADGADAADIFASAGVPPSGALASAAAAAADCPATAANAYGTDISRKSHNAL